MITIIRLKDGLLINSICDPDKRSSVVSFGWNRKNIRTFLKNLNDVKNGITVEEIIEKPENEWSLKRIGVRLLMYPISVVIIAVGVFAIFSSTVGGVIAGMTGISLVAIWIYVDIKMIIKQRKARKNNK
jgi:hypothetical protein